MPDRTVCVAPRFDRLSWMIALVAAIIAASGARPFAGSWNDASRLAAVESLVDYHTWAIDQSIFAQRAPSGPRNPFGSNAPLSLRLGTWDKMWIDGHFYSDKPPVLSVVMAAVYRGIQFVTGLVARDHPGPFCYWMTLLTSGVAYVVSVSCIDRLARLHGLQLSTRILVVVSFAVGTMALVYSRQVNSHIISLALCSALLIYLSRRTNLTLSRLIAVGSLLGASYALDVVIGSALVLCTVLLIVIEKRGWKTVFIILIAAFPWFALHHALNYRIGGTFVPANVNPAFFRWSNLSWLDATSLTGAVHHDSLFAFVGYALDLLVGRRGLLLNNTTLLLALGGGAWLVRRDVPETRDVWFAVAIMAVPWIVYSIFSSNHAGACFSVRWFVPLLAPGYYILILFLRREPEAEAELKIVTIGSVMIAILAWRQGPWDPRLVPGFWLILGATWVTWLSLSRGRIGRRLSEIVNKKSGRSINRPVGAE